MHNDWLLLLKGEYLTKEAYHINHHRGEFVPVRCVCHLLPTASHATTKYVNQPH